MSSFLLRPATDADAQAVVELVSALDVALLGSTDYSLADLHDEWRDIAPEDRFLVEDDGSRGRLRDDRAEPAARPVRRVRAPGAFRARCRLLPRERARAAPRRARGDARAERGARPRQRAHDLLRAARLRGDQAFLAHADRARAGAARAAVAGRALGLAVRPRRRGGIPRGVRGRVRGPLAARAPVASRPGGTNGVERDDFSPELWAVVRDGDQIVAGTILRPERLGVAWLARLFTRREWRRRGVGEALLYDAFGAFWRLGKPTIGLGVDAQSDTGAQRLYERVGMHVHWGAVVFEKEVSMSAVAQPAGRGRRAGRGAVRRRHSARRAGSTRRRSAPGSTTRS